TTSHPLSHSAPHYAGAPHSFPTRRSSDLPVGHHYRTRLTHTLEVSQIARTIARALRLNEDLTEAIAQGHDLGHTPFGHSGEAVRSEEHTSELQSRFDLVCRLLLETNTVQL